MNESKMTSSVVMVDPVLAAQWLAKNANHNRPLRPTAVAGYAQQMQRGHWQLTHQGVAFDVNGILLDGQHRLAAVVQSNCTVSMMVTFNAPPVSFEALDCGIARSISDRLNVSRAVVAIITATVCIEGGNRRKVDQHTVAKIHASHFGRAADMVVSGAGKGTRRHMSNAWVASAACVAIIEGQKPSFVIEQRRILCAQDEDNETASAKSFRRRFQNLSTTYTAQAGFELFACALRVFEYESRDIKVIKLVGEWREGIRERASAALSSTNNGGE